jgi:hypothetical protein
MESNLEVVIDPARITEELEIEKCLFSVVVKLN